MDEQDAIPICPFCLRPIPVAGKQSLSKLVPRLKGGKNGPTVLLHHICHYEIHATLTEARLARAYDTLEKLRAHPRYTMFIAWVAERPPTFHSEDAGTRRQRRGQLFGQQRNGRVPGGDQHRNAYGLDLHVVEHRPVIERDHAALQLFR